MSKVLITFESINPTIEVNLTLLRHELSLLKTEVREKGASKVIIEDLQWCEVCIAIRPNSIFSCNIASSIRNSGRFYILLMDDDIINLPIRHPDNWKSKYSLKCLECANALISPNPLILGDYCKGEIRALLVDHLVKEEDIKPIHVVGEPLRIVYPAGKDHAELFNKFISPFFAELLDKYKNKIDITFVGVKPDLGEFSSSLMVHYVNSMPYKQYTKYMFEHDFDIGIAPLDTNEFSSRKYFVKYIEYARFGIVGLYSDTKPYNFVVENGKNGLLVGDSDDCWKESLFNIIEDTSKIESIVRNSQNDLKNRFSPEIISTKLGFECPELESFSLPRENLVKYNVCILSAFIYYTRSFFCKLIYHYRTEGISYFYNKIGKG